MAYASIAGLILLALFTVSHCTGELCIQISDNLLDGESKTFFCDSGCCGDLNDRYCCWDNSVAMFVGTGVGSLVLIFSVIVCIVCCCRRRGMQGQIVGNTGPGYTLITTTVGGAPYTALQSQTGQPQSAQPQMGYDNAYPQMPQPTAPNQQWAQSPTAYDTVNP